MKGKNAATIKEITLLPGYYECPKCHSHYLSDFPFVRSKCLECGSRIPVTDITTYELNGLLYNLHILAETNDTWTKEQICEFCHYEDSQRATLLMRFLLGNGYVRFKEEKDVVSELVVYTTKIVLNQTRGA